MAMSMAWLDSPQVGTVVFVLMALWNGVGLSNERNRPANALIGLLLTVAALASLALRPARVSGLLFAIPYHLPITGHPAIDAFLLAVTALALVWTLVDIARHELLRYERSRFAVIASGLNRACLGLFAVVSVGYAVVALI